MDEFARIDRFVASFARPTVAAGVALGPGDDAALLAPRPGLRLAVTTDAVRAGVHFGPLFRPAEIGHKALAVNLSDLAAMGARPRWFFVALELPPDVPTGLIDGLARGMSALAKAQRCALAGGNVSRAPVLGITLTALGEVPADLALRRDALRVGDVLAVTGALGGAAFGLRQLAAGTRRGARAQLRPQPRVAEGLAALGLARAAIDVSDGLAQDLGHLAERSGVGIALDLARLPLSPVLRGVPDALDLALRGGEDYALVFGVARAKLAALREKLRRLGCSLTEIGEAIAAHGLWQRAAGGLVPLAANGFQHP